METYIALLRGINVSGQKLLKMGELKSALQELSFDRVTTYLQSGNVVFKAKAQSLDELALKISRQIHQTFGFEVAVVVLSVDQLGQIILQNPFAKEIQDSDAGLYVTYLKTTPCNFDFSLIQSKLQEDEAIVKGDGVVYFYCPKGYGRTKLNNNFLESKLGVVATTRNWKTTKEMFKISQELNLDV
jgi:uncharacterized protein (DUF1697 family)